MGQLMSLSNSSGRRCQRSFSNFMRKKRVYFALLDRMKWVRLKLHFLNVPLLPYSSAGDLIRLNPRLLK